MANALVPDRALTVQPQDSRASGWYGMTFLIATEAALFIYLLFSYFFLASQSPGPWPPSGPPEITVAAINTVILLASSVAAWWGQRGIERGSSRRLLIGLVLATVLGAAFAGVQVHEWANKSFSPRTDAYGSLFFTITGVHIAHVVIGLAILFCLALWTAMGRFSAAANIHVKVGLLYWHFVDVVWLVVFAVLFLSPRLGTG